MQKEKIRQNQKGITLIALIITIIVMLILVGVSVTVALKGGLFSTAKSAKAQTQEERDKEQNLAEGKVEIGGVWYNSIEEYTNGKSSGGETESAYKESITGLAQGVTLVAYNNLETEASADIKAAVDEGKVQAVLKETVTEAEVTTTYTAVVPTGFEISTTDGEDSIAGGLVIKDGDNEFVWIPYTSEEAYEEDNIGPLEGTDDYTGYDWDSQDNLNSWYGMNEDGSPYYSISDFTYETDKANIETSINKYNGFYVGRYETTYDSTDEYGVPNGIGVKRGKNVLQSTSILKSGTNTISDEDYYYRWWGLYKVQKDLYKGEKAVFSTMITNKQRNLIMNFTGYGDTIREEDTYTNTPDLSGAAYVTDNTMYDVSKNIYDLAGNVHELALGVYDTDYVFYCGR